MQLILLQVAFQQIYVAIPHYTILKLRIYVGSTFVRPSVRQSVLASSNPVLGFDFNTIIRGWQFVLPKVFLCFFLCNPPVTFFHMLEVNYGQVHDAYPQTRYARVPLFLSSLNVGLPNNQYHSIRDPTVGRQAGWLSDWLAGWLTG